MDNKYKLGWRVVCRFIINLHKKDLSLLNNIKEFFGVGNVSLHGDSAHFDVGDLGELVCIIEHFNSYPLKTQKYVDFLLFQKAFNIIRNKKHLTKEGLEELISLRASINKGLPERLKEAFPSIKPVVKPEVPKSSLDPNNSNIKHWVGGFVSGEGCFSIQISKSKTHKLGMSVGLNFSVVQNIRDSYLLVNFEQFFGCGNVSINEKSGIVTFSVRNIPDNINKVIPFFEESNIQGVKAKDFNDFKEASFLINSKLHLTKEGFDKILLIKSRMNFNR